MSPGRSFVFAVLLSIFPAIGCASAEESIYALDNEHTHIVWTVDRFGFTKTVATFADVSGVLALDQKVPENSRVSAVIQVSSIRSDMKEREEIIRGPFWLDALQFPTISFESSNVALIDDGSDIQKAIVTGDLLLHGVTSPVEMMVTLNKIGIDPVTKRDAAGFTATGKLSRRSFGVETALGPIGDEVAFTIEALAVKSVE